MKIAVLGCGRWGSFHAWYAQRIGHQVMLWGRKGSKHLQALQETALSESDAKKYASQFEDYPDLRDEFVKTIATNAYPDNDPVLVHGFSAEDLKDIFQCSAQDAYLYLLRMETNMVLTQYVKEQADDDLL